ncbi:MAG: hypothetical protein ACLP6E_17310 [Acidimicrobiales bacterium]
MATLPDGTYDAIVIEADQVDGTDFRLELTITLGPHIGRVIALRGRHVDTSRHSAAAVGDPLDFLGVPGTLIVRAGVPTFRPELA